MKKNGFTLLELIVVSIIIGILAAVAIPSFRRARVVREGENAVAVLQTVRAAVVMYYNHYGAFHSVSYGNHNEIYDFYGVNVPNGTNFDYGVGVLGTYAGRPVPTAADPALPVALKVDGDNTGELVYVRLNGEAGGDHPR